MNIGATELAIVVLMCVPVILLVGIAAVLIIRRREMLFARRVRCPHCAEWIMAEAEVCRYCGRPVNDGSANA